MMLRGNPEYWNLSFECFLVSVDKSLLSCTCMHNNIMDSVECCISMIAYIHFRSLPPIVSQTLLSACVRAMDAAGSHPNTSQASLRWCHTGHCALMNRKYKINRGGRISERLPIQNTRVYWQYN